MKASPTFRIILLFALLLQVGRGYAQFVEFSPIHYNNQKKTGPFQEQGRQASNISLPFWDDFSKGINPNKWQVAGASYTQTIGNSPPSLGMVLFNGVDEKGRQYSLQEKDQGESDFLSSKTIDLSLIPPEKQTSLYLSFFWQAGGKAEAPNANDRLSLQVFLADGSWQTLWEKQGGDNLDRSRFFQEIIQIKPEWQHANFQFRFFSRGNQSGPFDAWLLDYIYLNTGRSALDLSYPDRALTIPTALRLDEFGAYPWELLAKNQSGKWSTLKSEFHNLENRFKAMEYSMTLRDSSGTSVLSVNSNTPLNPVPRALERRSIISRSFTEIPTPTGPGDLFAETFLTTGDGLLTEIESSDTIRYAQVDFRENDRVSTRFPLRDYFAYDQGSADYAAGINQRSGQLAVAYLTPEPVFLKGVSIDFTNANQVNQILDLVVWSDLSKAPIYSKEVIITEKKEGQALHYFPLEEPLAVKDTFYIGYTQFTNDFLHVGLDKRNDTGNRIHYNVGGAWAQNMEVKGSLMIRPHVSKEGKASGGKVLETSLRIYPNPAVSEVFVEGEFSSLRIVDAYGREIVVPRMAQPMGEMLNFNDQKPGLYLIYAYSSSGPRSFRILVTK
jgi:hypothetical protein